MLSCCVEVLWGFCDFSGLGHLKFQAAFDIHGSKKRTGRAKRRSWQSHGAKMGQCCQGMSRVSVCFSNDKISISMYQYMSTSNNVKHVYSNFLQRVQFFQCRSTKRSQAWHNPAPHRTATMRRWCIVGGFAPLLLLPERNGSLSFRCWYIYIHTYM